MKINDLSLYSKYAFRDLIRSYSKILSIIITLLISLFILSAILTIEDSLENELNENSKVLLGGDLEIDYNNREGDRNLIKQVENISTVSQIVEFSTMISTIEKKQNKTSFSRIKAIDQNYPLYGDVIFEPVGSLKKLNEIDNTILVNENIFKNLNLKINDIVKVQNIKFKVIGVVKVLPDIGGAFVFGDFALTGKKTLDKLELNTLGSFLNYEYKIKFDDYKNKDKKINEIKKIFKNNDKVKIRYPENSAGGIKRIIDNFSQFLSLVSISAMLIAGIGIANTLLSFINQKNSSIAVQKAIGINSGNIKTIYYLQLLISLIFISLVAYGLSFFLVPVVDKYISDGLGLNIQASFSLTNLFIVFMVGLLVIIIFSIPTVNSIDQIKASSLFRNVFQSLQFKYSKLSISLSLLLLTILISLFAFRSSIPTYSLIYFASFFVCLAVFFYVSRFIILLLRNNLFNLGISSKIAIKNITQSKSITPITVMSLGLGMTLLLTLAFVGSNFKREIAKSIPEIAPDYFFLGIQNNQKNLFKKIIIDSDKEAVMEIVPMVSAGLVKINGIDPNTYISNSNDSYWVIMNDRRVSWVNTIPKDNPILEGSWWDTSKPNKLQISLDSKVAKDFGVSIGDKFTLRIYGREIEGEVVNFRLVNYQDLSINFAMLLNPQFAENIPHEYLSTIKFKNIKSFNEVNFLDKFPSVSIIKISDYLSKVTDVLNKVFIAVSIISAVTVIIGLVVISSAIIVQGKIKIFQNLVFKILGFSKKEIIMSSIIEFIISFLSIIFFSTIFAVFASKFIIENIFQLKWLFEINIFFYVTIGIGVATLALIIITNFRYLSPKVYPLVRNE